MLVAIVYKGVPAVKPATMNTFYTNPEADKKWPQQWQRIVGDWGNPKPTRSQMNGNASEGFLRWMNCLTNKAEAEAVNASGDGYWECRVHWREVRISHLKEAKEELEAGMNREKGHKMVKKGTVGSAVRPLYPSLKSSLPLNKGIVRASPPTPPPVEHDLSQYSIDREDEETPPPSPSDVTFSVKEEEKTD